MIPIKIHGNWYSGIRASKVTAENIRQKEHTLVQSVPRNLIQRGITLVDLNPNNLINTSLNFFNSYRYDPEGFKYEQL